MHGPNLTAQDRRRMSRIATCLDCRFESSGISRDGVVIDLSLEGAYVSSSFIPPEDGRIRLTILSDLVKRPLAIEGRVRRWHVGMAESGKGRFGVKFDHAPIDLADLIRRLVNNPSKEPRSD